MFICFPSLFTANSPCARSHDSVVFSVASESKPNIILLQPKERQIERTILQNETTLVFVCRGCPFDGPEHKSYFCLFLRKEIQWEWTPDSDHGRFFRSDHRGHKLEPEICNKGLEQSIYELSHPARNHQNAQSDSDGSMDGRFRRSFPVRC